MIFITSEKNYESILPQFVLVQKLLYMHHEVYPCKMLDIDHNVHANVERKIQLQQFLYDLLDFRIKKN